MQNQSKQVKRLNLICCTHIVRHTTVLSSYYHEYAHTRVKLNILNDY